MLVTVKAQGNVLEKIIHSRVILGKSEGEPRFKRGAVMTFSQSSQLRLMKLNAKISPAKIKATGCKPVFLTLTYQRNESRFWKAKRDLKVFLQRIARLHPGASAIWKMELQERGAIHFHLMCYGLPFTPISELQEAWNEITGEDATNSVDIELIRSHRGAQYYCAKYLCKGVDTKYEHNQKKDNEEEYLEQRLLKEIGTILTAVTVGLSIIHIRLPAPTGRWWGVHNRSALPLAEAKTIHIDLSQTDYLEWVTSLREDYARCYRSFTVFTSKAYAYLWRLKQKILANADYYTAQYRHRQAGRGFSSRWLRYQRKTPTEKREIIRLALFPRISDYERLLPPDPRATLGGVFDRFSRI